jgi:hypothetical protein
VLLATYVVTLMTLFKSCGVCILISEVRNFHSIRFVGQVGLNVMALYLILLCRISGGDSTLAAVLTTTVCWEERVVLMLTILQD